MTKITVLVNRVLVSLSSFASPFFTCIGSVLWFLSLLCTSPNSQVTRNVFPRLNEKLGILRPNNSLWHYPRQKHLFIAILKRSPVPPFSFVPWFLPTPLALPFLSPLGSFDRRKKTEGASLPALAGTTSRISIVSSVKGWRIYLERSYHVLKCLLYYGLNERVQITYQMNY